MDNIYKYIYIYIYIYYIFLYIYIYYIYIHIHIICCVLWSITHEMKVMSKYLSKPIKKYLHQLIIETVLNWQVRIISLTMF